MENGQDHADLPEICRKKKKIFFFAYYWLSYVLLRIPVGRRISFRELLVQYLRVDVSDAERRSAHRAGLGKFGDEDAAAIRHEGKAPSRAADYVK